MGSDAAAPVAVRPAATVLVLRDGPTGLEVLLVRRDRTLAFHGGAWVFPGGRVDDTDRVPGDDDLAAARRAAAREVAEEVGLTIDPARLVALSHWTTPVGRVRRFATWFFLCPAPAAPDGSTVDGVVVDDVEIRAHAWRRPDVAIAAFEAGEVEIAAPTYVSLLALAGHDDVATALRSIAAATTPTFTPVLRALPDGGEVALYEGDVAYADGDLHVEGPRHRLRYLDGGYAYERSG